MPKMSEDQWDQMMRKQFDRNAFAKKPKVLSAQQREWDGVMARRYNLSTPWSSMTDHERGRAMQKV